MQNVITAPITYDTIADLKDAPTYPGATVLLTGNVTPGDGLGGFYRWDSASVATEDNTIYNVILSNITTPGRWLRVFQRTITLPHGRLEINGQTRRFYATMMTDANSRATLNLTVDNTTNGAAIFKTIDYNDSQYTGGATGPATSVTSYIVSTTADLKQTTHGYFKANGVTVTLGLVYAPFAGAGNNIPVRFQITGT